MAYKIQLARYLSRSSKEISGGFGGFRITYRDGMIEQCQCS